MYNITIVIIVLLYNSFSIKPGPLKQKKHEKVDKKYFKLQNII